MTAAPHNGNHGADDGGCPVADIVNTTVDDKHHTTHVTVACPYCHRLHYHGIPHGQSGSNQVRNAHCPTRYVRVGRGARAFYRPIRERRGEYLIGPRP